MPRKSMLSVSTEQLPLPFNRSGLFPIGDSRQSVTVTELAKLTGYPSTTIYEWAKRRRIPGAMQPIKGARWRFRRPELEEWWGQLIKD